MNTIDLSTVTDEWNDLLQKSQSEYIFGDEFDTKSFKQCMEHGLIVFRETLNFEVDSKDYALSMDAATLYANICAYSEIKSVTDDNCEVHDASRLAAEMLYTCIRIRELFPKEGTVISVDSSYLTGIRIGKVSYDVSTGDLSELINLIKISNQQYCDDIE